MKDFDGENIFLLEFFLIKSYLIPMAIILNLSNLLCGFFRRFLYFVFGYQFLIDFNL